MAKLPRASATHQNKIGDAFWAILIWHKFLGNCPIVKRKRSNGKSDPGLDKISPEGSESKSDFQETIFQFYPEICFEAVVHVCLNCVFIIASTLFVINVVFAKPFVLESLIDFTRFPEFIQPINDSVCLNGYNTGQIKFMEVLFVKFGGIMFQMVAMTELFFSWWTGKDFARFLNNWSFFTEQFIQEFGLSYTNAWKDSALQLRRFKKILLGIYAIVPTFFFLPLFTITSLQYNDWTNVFVMIVLFLQIIPRSLMEDAKILFSYKMLQTCYLEIEKGITAAAQHEGAKLDAATIKAWGNLLEIVRSQGSLLQKTQSVGQLTLMLFSTIFVTLLIFVVVNSNALMDGSGKICFQCLAVGFPIFYIGRLYLKVLVAERVTIE
ncbi:unnamed protein product, partial [Allacma fusca]